MPLGAWRCTRAVGTLLFLASLSTQPRPSRKPRVENDSTLDRAETIVNVRLNRSGDVRAVCWRSGCLGFRQLAHFHISTSSSSKTYRNSRFNGDCLYKNKSAPPGWLASNDCRATSYSYIVLSFEEVATLPTSLNSTASRLHRSQPPSHTHCPLWRMDAGPISKRFERGLRADDGGAARRRGLCGISRSLWYKSTVSV